MEDKTGPEARAIVDEGNRVLVDIWAPWCGPCKALAPTLEKMSTDFPNIRFVKVNVDENREFAEQYGVKSVPTLLFFEEGDLKEVAIGPRSKEQVTEAFPKFFV